MPARPRVLIVDDEERFRNTMSKLLSVSGFPNKTTGSGKQAIEELTGNSYDVAIVDVRMPEMSGVELLSDLKKIDPTIEVIILTGYASLDTAKAIIKLGAFDYMLKPYAIEELTEKIEAAYDRKIARARLTSHLT
ncbi:MAG: response regulator [Thermodesulfobacteriota bacterium]